MKAIAPLSPVASTGAFQPPQITRPDTPRPPKDAAPQSADLRLIIEEDEQSGAIVYKTLDRRTGEVVRQLPREEVLRLKDDPAYDPGDIVNSKS
ncbi:MAG: flagellar protein FlaG [Caulobacter sp.]|nr:flagellar protein FlaG [Caulobacter sp.]